MARFISIFCLGFLFSFIKLQAQDYSNQGLINIKEQSEAGRMDWEKAFNDGIAKKSFVALPAIRQANEKYLDAHISDMKRLFAEGDGRALLSSVSNYLQIERQFVRDVMVPAETLNPNDQDAINKVNQKIDDFGGKEKMFLIDINNAIRTLPPPSADAPVPDNPEMNTDDDDARGSIVEDREPSKKDKKSKHKKSDDDSDDDGE